MLISGIQHNDLIFIYIAKWSLHKSSYHLSPYKDHFRIYFLGKFQVCAIILLTIVTMLNIISHDLFILLLNCLKEHKPMTLQLCMSEVWHGPHWAKITTSVKVRSFLAVLRENPFPCLFQLLEAAHILCLLTTSASSKWPTWHLSDHSSFSEPDLSWEKHF